MHSPPPSRSREGRQAPYYALDSARGLPTNQIHRLAMDDASRLWFATPIGLSRFDGSSVETWDRHRGLQCNGLRSLGLGGDGTVWVGTDLGLEALDASGRPLDLSPLSWRFGLCQDIDASGTGAWIGAAHGMAHVTRRSGNRGLHMTFSADIGFVNDIHRFDEHQIFAASTERGLVETNGAQWGPFRCPGLPRGRVSRLATGRSGALLVGATDGLYIVDVAGKRVTARWVGPDGDPAVTAIATDPELYWVAFGRTVVAFDAASDHATEPVVREVFDVDSPVNDLLRDHLGNVWIATNNSGLAQVSCLRRSLERIDLGANGGVYSIRRDRHGALLIGGEQVFGRLKEAAGDGPLVDGPAGLPPTTVWDVHEDETGMWAATQSGLFRSEQGGDFVAIPVSNDILDAPARALQARGTDIWVGTLRGLVRIGDGKQISVNDPDGVSLGYVYAMHEDAGGRLWVATLGRGLWREGEHGLESFIPPPLSAAGNTYAVVAGPPGWIVVLQDDKVVVINPDQSARPVAELRPVAGWSAHWIDDKTLALGTSDGLRMIDLDTGHVIREIRSPFAPRDWEFTSSLTLTRDANGRLLCGVNGGLMRVDLERLKPLLAPPSCRLANLSWNGAEAEKVGAAHSVQAGRWKMRVRVFSAWFVDHLQLSYQFQLIGFDKDWTAATRQPETTYTSLPAGLYRLMARAHSPLTGFGPSAEIATIRVEQPWWALGWASALSFLDSLYDRVVRGRKRNEKLIEANVALEKAVEARTESLLAAQQDLERLRDAYKRLSEVDELTQLGNRRKFDAEFGRGVALAGRLKIPFSMMMLDIDHFKAVNDRLGHHRGDEYLAAVARVLSATVRQGEDVATRFGGEEFAVLLSNTGIVGAISLAERIRAEIEALNLPNPGAPGGIMTISIGVAALLPETGTAETLCERADRALYRAKHAGRNRVESESD